MEPRGGTEAAVTARVATPRAARSAAAPRISARAAGEAHEPPKAMHVPRRESADPRKGDERKRAVFRTRALARRGPDARGFEVARGGRRGRRPRAGGRGAVSRGARGGTARRVVAAGDGEKTVSTRRVVGFKIIMVGRRRQSADPPRDIKRRVRKKPFAWSWSWFENNQSRAQHRSRLDEG